MTTPVPLNSPRSQRIYKWALETRFEGLVDTEAVKRASQQWYLTRLAVWVLDASPATFDGPAVLAIPPMLASLRRDGLDRVALVLPERLQDKVPTVLSMVANLPMAKVQYPAVRSFKTREDVMLWLQLGCRDR